MVIIVQMLESLDFNSLEITATDKYEVTYMSGASWYKQRHIQIKNQNSSILKASSFFIGSY